MSLFLQSQTTWNGPVGAARDRLPEVKGEPLAIAEWYRPIFFHYELEPAVVRDQLPHAFKLALHHDKAIVSLVPLTMRRFRPNPAAPLWARGLRAISEQRFFNLRTYVRHRGEAGAFFFWSWLSRPWGVPLPARPFGLTCSFADSQYRHEHESGLLQGSVTGTADFGRFAYHARIESGCQFVRCPAGSIAEFALERSAGYFWHRGAGRVFRAGHPPWLQAPLDAHVEDDSLVVRAFSWFKAARFIEAHYAPGFDAVGIGRPHRLTAPQLRYRSNHHGPSALFELP